MMGEKIRGARLWWRYWRRLLKSKLPYVRRREYSKLMHRHLTLLESLAGGTTNCTRARLVTRKSIDRPLGLETCLFVTYAPQPVIKRHVVRHIEALLAAGFDVVLIINTSHDPAAFDIGPSLNERLAGVFIRENLGFDFAAWAHVHTVIRPMLSHCNRLVLVNDSIVGPLREDLFNAMLQAIRSSPSDVVGLTENREPRHHLQSFFLVFQGQAVQSEALADWFADVRNLPAKELVIDLYETFLTRRLQALGFSCTALYPNLATGYYEINDTYYRWEVLIERGFPYIKTSVLEEQWDTNLVRQLVPEEFRSGYEFANRIPTP